MTPRSRSECADASPIALAPRFNAAGAVVGPMTPAPFINPAVIHRTAAILAGEEGRSLVPFRYREGIVDPGQRLATLPLRYVGGGRIDGNPGGVPRRWHGRGRQSARWAAAAMRKTLPSSGFGPYGRAASRTGTGGWRSTRAPPAATTCGSTSTPTGTPAT